MGQTVHVFGIKPGSKGEEVGYAHPYWEPEPDDSATDEEYNAWEDRNPIWGLCEDLDCYLDSDFVEYLGDEEGNFWEYLAGYVTDDRDLDKIREALVACREFVLIFDSALGGFDANLRETEGALYAGEFACSLDADEGPIPCRRDGDHSGRILIARTIQPRLAVTAGRYGEVRFWDTSTAEPIEVQSDHSVDDFVHAIALSPDLTSMYSCSDEVLHWNLASRPIVSRSMVSHGGYQIGGLGLIPNRNRLAIACVDGSVGLIDLNSDTETLLNHQDRVTAVLPVPDGDHLISVISAATLAVGQGSTFAVWALDSEEMVRRVSLPHPYTRLLLLIDHSTVLYGTDDGRLVWWDWRSDEPLRVATAFDDNCVDAIALSASEHLAATAGAQAVKVWRVNDGELMTTFDGHSNDVKAVCFLDDDHIVSGSRDATIRIWRLSDQQELARFTDAPADREEIPGYLDDPWEVHCLTADGNTIVAGETSGRVRILRFDGRELELLR